MTFVINVRIMVQINTKIKKKKRLTGEIVHILGYGYVLVLDSNIINYVGAA